MIFAGGVPLNRGGEVVGAIGVSGGLGKQDQAVAEAGSGILSIKYPRGTMRRVSTECRRAFIAPRVNGFNTTDKR